MPETKIGVDQVNRPAPLWYRRFSNAAIIFIVPALSGLIAGWGMSEHMQNRWLQVLIFAPALIKGIGVMIGNGEYIKTYAPDKESV